MKLLSLNFLTCAVRTCKSAPTSFPLHPQDAELERVELDFSPQFLRNVLPRLEWGAMEAICAELGLRLPHVFAGSNDRSAALAGADGAVSTDDAAQGGAQSMEGVERSADAPSLAEEERKDAEIALDAVTDEDLKALHSTLIETQIVSGKLVCGNCGHEYAVKEGIANFLLPAHLV